MPLNCPKVELTFEQMAWFFYRLSFGDINLFVLKFFRRLLERTYVNLNVKVFNFPLIKFHYLHGYKRKLVLNSQWHWLYFSPVKWTIRLPSRRRRTELSVSCPCLIFVRIFRKIVSVVCLLSGFCPDVLKKCCPISVCSDFACPDSVQFPESVRILEKKPVRCLSFWLDEDEDRRTLMLMTTLCWWFYDGDRFKMLVTDSLCRRLFRNENDCYNILNWLTTSGTCHQHILSPTSVTDIDVTSRRSCPDFHCPCPQSSVDIQYLTLICLISARVFQDL